MKDAFNEVSERLAMFVNAATTSLSNPYLLLSYFFRSYSDITMVA